MQGLFLRVGKCPASPTSNRMSWCGVTILDSPSKTLTSVSN